MSYRRHASRASQTVDAWLAATVLAVIALVAAGCWPIASTVFSRVHRDRRQPNVILLGIDSLRLEELERFGGKARAPARTSIEFLEEADLVRDASTPMPRTFGSWVVDPLGTQSGGNGARNNLTPGDEVVPNPTIADVLRQHGYQTIYSTDEVRFANIDESYGFDKVITPPIGASDFIIGTYNELAAAVGRHQHPARPAAVSVLVRQSRGRDRCSSPRRTWGVSTANFNSTVRRS